MDKNDAKRFRASAHLDTIVLDSTQVVAMRRLLHELANVLTGVMISGGLLSQYLEGQTLAHYACGVCEGCERGCNLVRELRGVLLAAAGEADLSVPSGGAQAPRSGREPDEGPV